MNEQQLAAVKQALEALKECRCDPRLKYEHPFYDKVITDLKQAIAQDALHKMAKNARELGLSYDNEPKIGCVNHDCDKCKAVQELVTHQDWCASLTRLLLSNPPQPAPCNCKQPAPQPVPVKEPEYWNVIDPAGNSVASETNAIRGWARIAGSYKPTVEGLLGFHDQGWRVLPKATPQPVPVKTYHDGKPWPVAPKPWVGLTDEEIQTTWDSVMDGAVFTRREVYEAIEAKLKEKNHD
jgi:hypothetical protein